MSATFQFAPAPYLPIKKYAELTGETEKAVSQQVDKGKLPTKPRNSPKEKIYINMVLLTKNADEQVY